MVRLACPHREQPESVKNINVLKTLIYLERNQPMATLTGADWSILHLISKLGPSAECDLRRESIFTEGYLIEIVRPLENDGFLIRRDGKLHLTRNGQDAEKRGPGHPWG